MAISAKRYALFLKDKNGIPALLRRGANNDGDRWSEHGLGHLLNPTDQESADRHWIGQAWLNMICKALGMLTQNLVFEERPAVGRVSVSSPAVMRPLAKLNDGKQYPEQIKPFNFLLSCHVRVFGHPTGAAPEHFHLITPYNNNPAQWLQMNWIDQYTGKTYRITTTGHHGTRQTARVKTYGDALREYPKADIPVVQLSIDETQPPSFHYEIGQRIAPLRDEGILIVGSGNVVHNLHAYAWGQHPQEPYEWAIAFEQRVRELLLSGENAPLVAYENKLGSEAKLAVPTPDHYLPLLYVIGTRTQSEPVTFPVEGVDGGSISMLTVQVGTALSGV